MKNAPLEVMSIEDHEQKNFLSEFQRLVIEEGTHALLLLIQTAGFPTFMKAHAVFKPLSDKLNT